MSQRQQALTAHEEELNDLWEEHLRTEFNAHSADEALATMVPNPLVNQVPVMIGGDGKEELREFYAKHFLPQIPADAEMVPVSRTIGQGSLVEEMIFRFTHTIKMDWMLPGIPPDRQADRGRDAGRRAVRGRQDGARALVLGPSLGVGPARANSDGIFAGDRCKSCAIDAR